MWIEQYDLMGTKQLSQKEETVNQKSCQEHIDIRGFFLGTKEQEGGPRGCWICFWQTICRLGWPWTISLTLNWLISKPV